MKKKILHLIQSLANGGCENNLLRTLPLLKQFDHTILTLKEKGVLAPRFEKENIIVIQKHYLFKQVKEINPDLIITYLFHADFIGRLLIQPLTHYKVIPFLRTTYNHPRYWLARWAELSTKKWARHYLANSQSVKDYYIKNFHIAPTKITVIPNGIDVSFFNKLNKDSDLINELKIKNSDLVIICVANLHINKGHKYLLEAFEQVFQKHKNIKLLLAGDGEEKENLNTQVRNYQSKENILFLGRRNDVAKLLKLSDIFVLPTLFEGMSNALLEAMTSGMAIITTDIPENRALIKNNETGILVKTKSSVEIKNSLEKIIENKKLKTKIGKNAKEKILSQFGIENTIKRFSNAVERLISI